MGLKDELVKVLYNLPDECNLITAVTHRVILQNEQAGVSTTESPVPTSKILEQYLVH